MWKSISQVLADQFGAYYSIKHKEKVHTGEMHEAWIIDDGVQPVFVKVNQRQYRSMFRAEADQLNLLAKTNTLKVPQVYGVGCAADQSFLLLEALPLQANTQTSMGLLGEQLARLHLHQGADNYGLNFDTWLGPEYQPNQWKENWAKFFAEQRIGWQFQICREKGLDFATDIKKIIEKSTALLLKHKPQPALLHGNLWIENCAAVNGQPVVYDPACYWGDRECDIAFSELFEPFPAEFYQSYNAIYPLDENYWQRKLVYQLYYLLNFSHRFQRHYVDLTQTVINKLLKETE